MTLKAEYKVGIIGCGKMGRDLFNFLINFPFQVFMVCKTELSAEELENTFHKKQKRSLKYQLIDQKTFDFRKKSTIVTTDLNSLNTCDLVVESINEELHKKRELFKQLEQILDKEAIVVSNTSSISPDILFKDYRFEERALGLHFFFPSSVKNIAEINIAENTSNKTIKWITGFLQRIGRFHIELKGADVFIINRIFLKMQAACCRLLQEDEIGEYEIDEIVKSYLFPIGIFEFFQHVGYDVMLQSVKNYLHYESDKVFYQPLTQYLENKINNGGLGIRIQKGIYEPSVDALSQKNQILAERVDLLQRITYWYLDGVYSVMEKNICSKPDLEHIVKEYMMVEKSPFELAQEVGYAPK